MSRRPFLAKACPGILITLLFCAVTAQRSVAQGCSCMTLDVVQTVSICFDGQIRTIDVTLCTDSFCPATGYPDQCATQPINGRTVIKNICPVGWSTTDIFRLLAATVSTLGVCCSSNTYLPQCTSNTDYVWLVSYGKCWQLDAATNCWNSDPIGPCCTFLFRYKPGVPVLGACQTTILSSCFDPGTCSPGYEEVPCVQLTGNPVCCY